MSVQQLDPDGEFSKLEDLLAQLGAPLGAHYDRQRHVLSANRLSVSLALSVGKQLGLRVETTTEANLDQRMDGAPTRPNRAHFVLIPSGRGEGYCWNKQDFPPGTYTTQQLAELFTDGLKQQIALWDNRFPGRANP